jgi:hypothetical protein
MKNCEHCRFLDTGLYGEGLCALFGDNSDNEFSTYDGCLLRCNEVKKLIRLGDEIQGMQYENYPNRPSEETKKKIDKTIKEYNHYLKILEARAKERRSVLQ